MSTDFALEREEFSRSASGIRSWPWREAFARYRVMLGLVAAYIVICLPLIAYYQPQMMPDIPRHTLVFGINSLWMFCIAGTFFAVGHVYRHRPASPFSSIWRALRQDHFSTQNLPNFFIAWFALVLTIVIFVKMKVLIPMINPFTIDPALSEWDRWLHFGTHPFVWLEPITNHPAVTWVLHRNYYAWFPIIYATYAWQAATRRDPVLRMQFLLSFVASWILIGTLMAIMFSSAGPIYYDRVAADYPQVYAPAMAYLDAIHAQSPLQMMTIKETLWNSYLGFGDSDYVRGISAMPSMHVALSFLLILFGWRKGPLVGTAYTIFGILIGIGSIHLLWHYAIDGYVSIAAVAVIWWVSGKVAKRAVGEDRDAEDQAVPAV